jgi:hypothetical protein
VFFRFGVRLARLPPVGWTVEDGCASPAQDLIYRTYDPQTTPAGYRDGRVRTGQPLLAALFPGGSSTL